MFVTHSRNLLLTTASAVVLLALLAVAMTTFGKAPDKFGHDDADTPSLAHSFAEPQSLPELVELSGNVPQGPDLVVVGVFSGPEREVVRSLDVPPAAEGRLIEVAPGVKVPPPPPPQYGLAYFTLTVQEVLVGDASPGERLTVVLDGSPSRSKYRFGGSWLFPTAGDRWLVMLRSRPEADGTYSYSVEPWWQFDVSGPKVRFAGDVPPQAVARLLGGRGSDEFARLLADAVRARKAAGPAVP